MSKITLNGVERKVAFTAYTAKVMYDLTGINLYDPKSLSDIFKSYEKDQSPTPADMEIVSKFIYSSLAAGSMPDNADSDWKPDFTPQGVANQISFRDGQIFVDIMAAYLGTTAEKLKQDTEKNQEAPEMIGAETE